MLEQVQKKALGEILCIVRRISAPTDKGIKRIPINSAELRQSGLSTRRLALRGNHDQGPTRGVELSPQPLRLGQIPVSFYTPSVVRVAKHGGLQNKNSGKSSRMGSLDRKKRKRRRLLTIAAKNSVVIPEIRLTDWNRLNVRHMGSMMPVATMPIKPAPIKPVAVESVVISVTPIRPVAAVSVTVVWPTIVATIIIRTRSIIARPVKHRNWNR